MGECGTYIDGYLAYREMITRPTTPGGTPEDPVPRTMLKSCQRKELI